MKKSIAASAVALLLAAGSLAAHHGYSEYDRSAQVTLEGAVKSVQWINPHILVLLETADRGEYTVEFQAPSWMNRCGVDRSAFLKVGDHVFIKGSVNRNPEKKILTLVREVRRPSDGWDWVAPAPQAPATK